MSEIRESVIAKLCKRVHYSLHAYHLTTTHHAIAPDSTNWARRAVPLSRRSRENVLKRHHPYAALKSDQKSKAPASGSFWRRV